ncbi:MAG: hypothetical protein AAF604_09045 [Acidobacteriota bacterium]
MSTRRPAEHWRGGEGIGFHLEGEDRVRIRRRDGTELIVSRRDLEGFVAWLGHGSRQLAAEPDEPTANSLAERLRRLVELPPRERPRLLESEPAWGSVGLVRLALAQSRALVFEDPARAVELAEIGRLVSSVLDPRRLGGPTIRDLQGWAEAMLGNARRVGGRLAASEECFFRAHLFLSLGTPGSPEETKVAALEVSLQRDLRQFEAALELSRAVIAVHQRRRNRPALVEALLTRSTIFEALGRPAAAVPVLRRAAELDDGASQDWIAHNLSFALARLDRRREARQVMALLGEAGSRPALRGRRLWLEGLVADDPVAPLEGARQLFEGQGFALDAALVGLDLTIALAARRRLGEARRVAMTTYRELLEQGATGDSLTAWRLLGRATLEELLDRERLTRELRSALAARSQ